MFKKFLILFYLLQPLSSGLIATSGSDKLPSGKQHATGKKPSVKVGKRSKPKQEDESGKSTKKYPGKPLEGSLFFKAMAEDKSVAEGEFLYKFKVRTGNTNEEYEEKEGGGISIANPTYDLTFKLLFLTDKDSSEGSQGHVEFIQPEKTQRTLISLLNGLYYPKFVSDDQTPQENRIIKIEVVDSTLLKFRKTDPEEKSKSGRTGSLFENSLQELRCDIVCKCDLGPSNEETSTHYVLYFDIEMQRKHISGRDGEFVEYVKALKRKYGKEVHLLAFLNYETNEKGAVSRGTMAFVKEGDDGANPLFPKTK
jgi:hypothetical protein